MKVWALFHVYLVDGWDIKERLVAVFYSEEGAEKYAQRCEKDTQSYDPTRARVGGSYEIRPTQLLCSPLDEMVQQITQEVLRELVDKDIISGDSEIDTPAGIMESKDV